MDAREPRLKEITERLDELEPFVDEYYRLEAAQAALQAPRGMVPVRCAAASAPPSLRAGRRAGSDSVVRELSRRRLP